MNQPPFARSSCTCIDLWVVGKRRKKGQQEGDCEKKCVFASMFFFSSNRESRWEPHPGQSRWLVQGHGTRMVSPGQRRWESSDRTNPFLAVKKKNTHKRKRTRCIVLFLFFFLSTCTCALLYNLSLARFTCRSQSPWWAS